MFKTQRPPLSKTIGPQAWVCAQLLSQLQPTRLLYPWDSPGKNTRVGCYFLLEGIFLTQGSNLSLFCFLHCGWILYPEPPGKPPDPQPWEIYKLENIEKETRMGWGCNTEKYGKVRGERQTDWQRDRCYNSWGAIKVQFPYHIPLPAFTQLP